MTKITQKVMQTRKNIHYYEAKIGKRKKKILGQNTQKTRLKLERQGLNSSELLGRSKNKVMLRKNLPLKI